MGQNCTATDNSLKASCGPEYIAKKLGPVTACRAISGNTCLTDIHSKKHGQKSNFTFTTLVVLSVKTVRRLVLVWTEIIPCIQKGTTLCFRDASVNHN